MKGTASFLFGIILMILGGIITLSNITVSSIGFYRVGRINSGVILILLLVVLIIAAIVFSKAWIWTIAFLDIIGIVISVVLGTRFRFAHITMLEMILMFGMFAVGAGLFLKGVLGMYKK